MPSKFSKSLLKMIISNNSTLKQKEIDLFESILNKLIDRDIDFIEKIFICNQENFEQCIQEHYPNEVLTKLHNCTVNGKTIFSLNDVIIFLVAENINNLIINVEIMDDKIVCKAEAMKPIRSIYHEIGHAKYYKKFGSENDSYIGKSKGYSQSVNTLWQILRSEAYAEMNVAKLYSITNTFNWYEKFNAINEEEQLFFQLNRSEREQSELHFYSALLYIHQYYLIPLFYKAGFLLGIQEYIDITIIEKSKIIDDIINCDIINNQFATDCFNNLILNIWEKFSIESRI